MSHTSALMLMFYAALIAGLAAAAPLGDEGPSDNPPVTRRAEATLRTPAGREARGTIDFYRTERAMAIHVHVTGAKPGMHALHIHTAACGEPASAADEALDAASRGSRLARRSPADLGMVLADRDGSADQWLRTDQLDVDGTRGIVGKSVVLHARGAESKLQKAGGIGEVVACGTIAAADGSGAAE
jgi:Cu-Zn family superoxide dismutase